MELSKTLIVISVWIKKINLHFAMTDIIYKTKTFALSIISLYVPTFIKLQYINYYILYFSIPLYFYKYLFLIKEYLNLYFSRLFARDIKYWVKRRCNNTVIIEPVKMSWDMYNVSIYFLRRSAIAFLIAGLNRVVN